MQDIRGYTTVAAWKAKFMSELKRGGLTRDEYRKRARDVYNNDWKPEFKRLKARLEEAKKNKNQDAAAYYEREMSEADKLKTWFYADYDKTPSVSTATTARLGGEGSVTTASTGRLGLRRMPGLEAGSVGTSSFASGPDFHQHAEDHRSVENRHSQLRNLVGRPVKAEQKQAPPVARALPKKEEEEVFVPTTIERTFVPPLEAGSTGTSSFATSSFRPEGGEHERFSDYFDGKTIRSSQTGTTIPAQMPYPGMPVGGAGGSTWKSLVQHLYVWNKDRKGEFPEELKGKSKEEMKHFVKTASMYLDDPNISSADRRMFTWFRDSAMTLYGLLPKIAPMQRVAVKNASKQRLLAELRSLQNKSTGSLSTSQLRRENEIPNELRKLGVTHIPLRRADPIPRSPKMEKLRRQIGVGLEELVRSIPTTPKRETKIEKKEVFTPPKTPAKQEEKTSPASTRMSSMSGPTGHSPFHTPRREALRKKSVSTSVILNSAPTVPEMELSSAHPDDEDNVAPISAQFALDQTSSAGHQVGTGSYNQEHRGASQQDPSDNPVAQAKHVTGRHHEEMMRMAPTEMEQHSAIAGQAFEQIEDPAFQDPEFKEHAAGLSKIRQQKRTELREKRGGSPRSAPRRSRSPSLSQFGVHLAEGPVEEHRPLEREYRGAPQPSPMRRLRGGGVADAQVKKLDELRFLTLSGNPDYRQRISTLTTDLAGLVQQFDVTGDPGQWGGNPDFRPSFLGRGPRSQGGFGDDTSLQGTQATAGGRQDDPRRRYEFQDDPTVVGGKSMDRGRDKPEEKTEVTTRKQVSMDDLFSRLKKSQRPVVRPQYIPLAGTTTVMPGKSSAEEAKPTQIVIKQTVKQQQNVPRKKKKRTSELASLKKEYILSKKEVKNKLLAAKKTELESIKKMAKGKRVSARKNLSERYKNILKDLKGTPKTVEALRQKISKIKTLKL